MNTEQITEAMQAGEEAVEKLIQAETDRRVTQARQTWEKDLPELVESEITKRQQKEKELADKRTAISEEIQAHFEGSKIDSQVWGELIDIDGLTELEGSERTAKIQSETQRIQELVDGVLKSHYAGKAPDRGDDPDQYHGTNAADVARAALGL